MQDRNALPTFRQILLVLDLESNLFQRVPRVFIVSHLGNPIAQLDAVGDLLVFRVGRVPLVRHDPFVNTESSSGLEDLEDLTVDAFKVGRMDGRFDRVNGVKLVLAKAGGEVHEIALSEVNQVLEAGLLGVRTSTGKLVVVVVDTGDVSIGKGGDFARGTANTTADVEDAHAGLEVHRLCEVVLVSRELEVKG